ncbi:MAG: phosphatidylglycerol lysyltransferase domain-containing protein [Candidatus Cloacimonadia bacterium]
MSKLDIDKLKPVELEDFEHLKEALKRHPSPRSAYSIVSLMIWGRQFDAHWMEYDDRVIFYNNTWNCILMPVGPFFSPEKMSLISDTFCQSGRCGNFTLVDSDYVQMYLHDLDNFDIIEDWVNADYVYLSEKLARLSGKKLQKKKNLISQFNRLFGEYTVADISVEDRDDCLALSDKWYDKDVHSEEGVLLERHALLTTFDHFELLEVGGKKILYNGEMIAFSIYSEAKDDMAIIHFEKYDSDYKGLAQLINWETAKHLSTMYHYINREEDLGLPGLRRAKQSYQPINHLVSYRFVRKKKNKMASNY